MTAETIPALTEHAAERFGDRVAVVDDVELTYTELLDEARRFGVALAGSGIEPGDRVAIWAPNSARWIVAALGLWESGAVLVPVNTRFKGAEAADILSRSRTRALITVSEFLGTDYAAMLEGFDLPDLETTVRVDGPQWDEFTTTSRPDDRDSPRSAPTTRPTSSSRRARPALRRAWCRHTAGRCSWPRTGWQ